LPPARHRQPPRWTRVEFQATPQGGTASAYSSKVSAQNLGALHRTCAPTRTGLYAPSRLITWLHPGPQKVRISVWCELDESSHALTSPAQKVVGVDLPSSSIARPVFRAWVSSAKPGVCQGRELCRRGRAPAAITSKKGRNRERRALSPRRSRRGPHGRPRPIDRAGTAFREFVAPLTARLVPDSYFVLAPPTSR